MAPLPRWLAEARADLARIGVDRMGIAPGDLGTPHLPGCRAVVVFASGGTGLWRHVDAAVHAAPERLSRSDHPVDDRVREVVSAWPGRPGRRVLRCADDTPVALDFRALAVAAGLGHPSRLGLVLHPEVGPWLALRVAVLTTEALPVDGPLPGPSPCAACDAPCQRACPVDAVPVEGLSLHRCARHRAQGGCHHGCDARSACPVGRSHRYGALQHRYHHHRPTGRAAWLARHGLRDGRPPRPDPWARWGAVPPEDEADGG